MFLMFSLTHVPDVIVCILMFAIFPPLSDDMDMFVTGVYFSPHRIFMSDDLHVSAWWSSVMKLLWSVWAPAGWNQVRAAFTVWAQLWVCSRESMLSHNEIKSFNYSLWGAETELINHRLAAGWGKDETSTNNCIQLQTSANTWKCQVSAACKCL